MPGTHRRVWPSCRPSLEPLPAFSLQRSRRISSLMAITCRFALGREARTSSFLLSASALFSAFPATAQESPSRTVEVTVPAGPVDTLGRSAAVEQDLPPAARARARAPHPVRSRARTGSRSPASSAFGVRQSMGSSDRSALIAKNSCSCRRVSTRNTRWAILSWAER